MRTCCLYWLEFWGVEQARRRRCRRSNSECSRKGARPLWSCASTICVVKMCEAMGCDSYSSSRVLFSVSTRLTHFSHHQHRKPTFFVMRACAYVRKLILLVDMVEQWAGCISNILRCLCDVGKSGEWKCAHLHKLFVIVSRSMCGKSVDWATHDAALFFTPLHSDSKSTLFT